MFLDHAAGTRLRPEALEAMLPWLYGVPGNAASAHAPGRAARAALDEARDVVAELVGADPGDVTFTSGGTEAADLAVRGTLARVGAGGATSDRPLALCSAVEHPAVLAPVVAAGGGTVEVDERGVVSASALEEALRTCAGDVDGGAVALVSIQTANNETGVVQPIPRLVEVVRRWAPGAAVHTDAVQAAGWLELPAVTTGSDLVGVSSHKLGGPRGAGALVCRGDADVAPVLLGGAQERGRRAGTVDVAAVVGFAAAARVVLDEREREAARVARLADRLLAGLAAIDGVEVTVPTGDRLPGIVHVCVRGVEREELVLLADRGGVAASAGSACASGALEPSHVLVAMGVDPEAAGGSLRLSLGWDSDADDVERALEVLTGVIGRLRGSAASALSRGGERSGPPMGSTSSDRVASGSER